MRWPLHHIASRYVEEEGTFRLPYITFHAIEEESIRSDRGEGGVGVAAARLLSLAGLLRALRLAARVVVWAVTGHRARCPRVGSSRIARARAPSRAPVPRSRERRPRPPARCSVSLREGLGVSPRPHCKWPSGEGSLLLRSVACRMACRARCRPVVVEWT